MAELSGGSSAVLAGARMIESAQRSVVQVRSGGRGIGAGVVWDPDGLVMTNHHVVAGGHRKVTVALHDGRATRRRASLRHRPPLGLGRDGQRRYHRRGG